MENDVNDVPRIRALVVDDNEDISEPLALLLRRNGYETVTASSGFEAIEKCGAGDFDVIISDIGMPRMNGYELAKKLRETKSCKTTIIIALTGYSFYDDRNRALQSGFDDLIVKPFGPRSLLATIERLRKTKR
jgi:CheY-like chemotaxis protein